LFETRVTSLCDEGKAEAVRKAQERPLSARSRRPT